ncbi:helix-turn-helix domain-containing protein [Selenomonas sp.]|uniref:helix-turn-helix domain-containing protein n=1 Tax=Selenomonas sp. TaxID=2053611 RepID=UPI00345C0B17
MRPRARRTPSRPPPARSTPHSKTTPRRSTSSAAALYQHPNTIRYRLKKAESLLEPVLGSKDVYEQLYFILRLSDLC